jgi:hypothetical protein
VVGIAGAGTTSYARTSAGGIVSWGNNPNGLLGIGSAMPLTSPTPLDVVCRAGDPIGSTFCSSSEFLQGVAAISAGTSMAFAFMSDGTVLTWGLNLTNQLGDGTNTNRNRPVNVCAVGAAEPCSVAGGNVLQGIVAVAGAANTGFALTSTGLALAWGVNNANTTGDGTRLNRSTPVNVCAVGASPVCAVANGNALQGVSTIAGGGNSGYAVLNDGAVLGWGPNGSGQLGDGTVLTRQTPVGVSGLGPGSGVIAVSAGAGSAVALRGDGSVIAWGANGVGELGDGTVYTANLTPAPVVFDDVTPPTLTFGAAVPAAANGANGWYITDVSFPWAAADAHSALNNTTNPPNPLVVGAEGFAITGSVTLCDIAENCATFWSPVVKIDKTAPQTAASATPDRLWPPDRHQVPVLIRVTASDNLELPSQPVSALTITSNALGSVPLVVQPGAFVLSGGTSGSSETTVQLIAEGGPRGQTRIYTITGTVKDGAGRSTPFSVAVPVANPK